MGNVNTAEKVAENFQGTIMNSCVEKVPDNGWKNVIIKGLKVASSWGRAVSEDHDPSTLPGQLKTFALDVGKIQTRTSPRRTHELKVSSNVEAVSKKVPAKKDNARQAVKSRATGPGGGTRSIQEGGAVDGSPPRTTSSLSKGTKLLQSKASDVTNTFLKIRSGSEFISPAKHRVPGDSTQGSVYGVDKQPSISTCGRDSPMESERQAPGIGKTRREDDQSVKMDGVASSSGWDMDTGPPCTDAWDEGWDPHAFTEGKWVPLPDRKLAKVAGSVDPLGQMGVTGSRLFPSAGSPQSGRAQSEYTNDDGWETVPKRKKKGFLGNKNPPTLQTGKVRSNRAMLQDSSGTTTSRSRAVEDFELMGKRLGGGNKLPGSHEEFGNRSKGYSISRESYKGNSSASYVDMLRGKGSLSVSPGRQRHFPTLSDSVYSIKNPERVPLRDTEGTSRVGTSKTEINADNMNMAFQNLIQEQSEERVETKGGSFSDDGEHEVVSSESDSQFYDVDNGEDSDEYQTDDEDDCKSDESEKSHDTKKKANWCRSFFQDLDFLSYEEIQDTDRQWHCPVCQGGVGAIDWYRGLGPLVTHAKTVRKRRVKHHLAFAVLLEEEIHLRGVQANSGTRFFGKWKGLQSENEDANQLILWPPMVVIQNTMLDFDDDSKWIGMGNQELIAYFKSYNPMKARHAYGPKGHRGMSLLLFEHSPAGYHDALRLGKHFTGARRSRTNWDDPGKQIFEPGGAGTRIPYGYMANKSDIEDFNRHCKGRNIIKYKLKPLEEVVLEPLRLMDDQNMKMIELQTTVEKQRGISEIAAGYQGTLQDTIFVISRNLHHREQELKVLQQRAEEQLITNKQQVNILDGSSSSKGSTCYLING
ncbi:hypothetical protein M758_4G161800 [Ceratodon purpureus]|nr:hypothetical protein M758_4G161800 [Ceratodon purpureus]